MIKRQLEAFLGACVARTIRRDRPTIIAVAGSVGKSSTKDAIGVALGAYLPTEQVVVSPKNYNNELGIPLTVFGHMAPGSSPLAWIGLLGSACAHAIGLRRLKARTLVLEMGTDHPGDLAYLTCIAPPKISVLTAIGAEHTEYFGSIEAVAKEESQVLRALGEDGVAVLNADDALVMSYASQLSCRVLTFGFAEDATARILETKIVIDQTHPDVSGLEVKLALYGTTRSVRFAGFVGKPQAYAAAAALAVASALDADDKDGLIRLEEQYHGMPGRMRLIPGVKGTWLIDDSYNSSPLAALSALRDLVAFPLPEDGRRLAALGDMLELGPLAERSHIDMGRAAAEAGIDMLFVCGTLAHVVSRAAIEAGMSQDQVFTFPSSTEAGRFIQERLRTGDVLLIKGSQGARMERIAKELMADPTKAGELLVRQTIEWE